MINMIKLDDKKPENNALAYKNQEIYLPSYKLSTTLQQIAHDRNLTFIINVNDMVNKPYLVSRVKKFIILCKKYNVNYILISQAKGLVNDSVKGSQAKGLINGAPAKGLVSSAKGSSAKGSEDGWEKRDEHELKFIKYYLEKKLKGLLC